MRYIACFVLLVFAIPKIATFQDCGSEQATLVDVSITGCVDTICNFSRSESINVSMIFTPKTYVKSVIITLSARFYFKYGNISVDLLKEDGCDCCMECPLDENKNVTINKYLRVPEELPSNAKARMVWKLVDDMNYILTCVTYLAYIY